MTIRRFCDLCNSPGALESPITRASTTSTPRVRVTIHAEIDQHHQPADICSRCLADIVTYGAHSRTTRERDQLTGFAPSSAAPQLSAASSDVLKATR